MSPEKFEPDSFARGERHDLDLTIPVRGHKIELPVVLVRGAKPGRRLVATAAVHGDEYEGIRAIFECLRELRPAEMSGDLLAVPVANPPAFWMRSRTSPLDGGNLARAFPGERAGDPTSALAWHLAHSIIRYADFYLDLHSGGIQCVMPTMVGYDAADPESRAAAFAFGAEVIWAHPTIAPGRTISEARSRGIPCLYTEARGGARIHPDDLKIFRGGLRNLMRHLEILPGEPETVPCRYRLLGDGNIDESISCTRDGFLIPSVDMLQPVVRGQRLGELTDLRGISVEQYDAPRDGVVALIHGSPLARAGEPVFLVTGLHP